MFKTFPVVLLTAALTAWSSHTALAQTVYSWVGTTDGNWQTSSNWSPSRPTSGTTINGRINVNNGAGNALLYTGAEGSTVLTGAGVRGLVIGSGVSGAMTVSGGSFSTETTDTGDIIGNGAGVTASLTVSGGSFTSSNSGGLTLALSGASTGNFTVAGGTATVTSLLLTGAGNTTGSATASLNGGVLHATSIRNGGNGTAVLNFNGGVLTARGSTATFVAGLSRANVRDGGARIHTNGSNVTVSQALVHSNIGGDNARDGGLTKDGLGVLTLSGLNTYTGDTVVGAGTLLLADNALLTFALNGGTFNSISGGGTLTLNGDFFFELSGVGAGSYTILNPDILAGTSYGSTFSIANAGWTESGNVWTSGDGLYAFSELTGQLSAVPEPSVTILFACGTLLALLPACRRSRVASKG